jgi:hypothetical protein
MKRRSIKFLQNPTGDVHGSRMPSPFLTPQIVRTPLRISTPEMSPTTLC